MENTSSAEKISFMARVGMAFRVVFESGFAAQIQAGLRALSMPAAKKAEVKSVAEVIAPERLHASGLFILSALQREGRFVDFLQQEVAGFSDEEVGAAARVIHAGCSKVMKQYFDIQPTVASEEGSTMAVPVGFDARRIRLTGNVSGQPPFKGTLKHHGWMATEIRVPTISDSLDPKIIAPAEVEL